jgi:hypothetical protein
MNAPELYEVRIAGHLSVTWKARFEGLCMRLDPGGETVLSGTLDQAGLHGVLVRVRDLGLKLVSVTLVGGTASAAPEKTPDAR